MPNWPDVSVVINTLNRAQSLRNAILGSLRMHYPSFEVIVVNGPSTDSTEDVLNEFASQIRVGRCEARNLSVSRNVGIEMARGQFVAFLDDDAIPDEGWLTELIPVFRNPEVAGASGLIFDHTGYRYQYSYVVCDRMANADLSRKSAPPDTCYPGTRNFQHVMGVGAFRRSVLLEVGGFDEEHEYFLDETDLCLRIIEAGYTLRHVEGAYVYHKCLPSHIRDNKRIVTAWYPILKNKIYFSIRHAFSTTPFNEIFESVDRLRREAQAALQHHVNEGDLSPEVYDRFVQDVESAWRDGLQRGFTQPRRLLDTPLAASLRGATEFDALGSPHLTFRRVRVPLADRERLRICLLARGYPPRVYGGIATFTMELARGLAEAGHIVHVLTQATEQHSTVDFEDEVWVHRIAIPAEPGPVPPRWKPIEHIWRYSRAMLEEVRRINAMYPVDIVEAPLWDSEALAFVEDGEFPVVTMLLSPLRAVIETNPAMVTGSAAEDEIYSILAAAELRVLTGSRAMRSSTKAVMGTIERLYDYRFNPRDTCMIPHGVGLPAPTQQPTAGKDRDRSVKVLYVGRFEGRKGTDVLLDVIPDLCRRNRSVRFILAGEDSPRGPEQLTITEEFLRRHAGKAFLSQVEFRGKVPSDELEQLYQDCSVFVAPSLYESFGLIYVEAMRYGKPVIGGNAGGVPEVISDGVNGLLVEPGNAASLEEALEVLIQDGDLRRSMGEAGKRIYDTTFTRTRMARQSVDFYQSLTPRFALAGAIHA